MKIEHYDCLHVVYSPFNCKEDISDWLVVAARDCEKHAGIRGTADDEHVAPVVWYEESSLEDEDNDGGDDSKQESQAFFVRICSVSRNKRSCLKRKFSSNLFHEKIDER